MFSGDGIPESDGRYRADPCLEYINPGNRRHWQGFFPAKSSKYQGLLLKHEQIDYEVDIDAM